MKKIIFGILLLTMVPIGAKAQWRSLQAFYIPSQLSDGEDSGIMINAIYFLDLPGPPRIGFVGLQVPESEDSCCNGSQVWKTTDGGWTWYQVGTLNGGGCIGFAFKDSLTGWFAVQTPATDNGSVFKTTDGGDTWNLLLGSPPRGAPNNSLYYHSGTDLLFLASEEGTNISSDEGSTWQGVNIAYQCSGWAFVDDSIGIMCGWNSSTPNSYTIDGGKTWSQSDNGSDCVHPLAIPGSKTFFTLKDTLLGIDTTGIDSLGKVLSRSDDGGKTWRMVSFIPIGDTTPYSPFGLLFGDLNHIYTQTSAGVLLSTDEGLTWQNLCGPKFPIDEWGQVFGGFYQNSHYIYCTDGHEIWDSTKLWYLNLDSMQDNFSSTVSLQFADSSRVIAVAPGSNVTVSFLPMIDSTIGVDSAHFAIHYDSASLALTNLIIPIGWSILDSSSSNGILNVLLTDTSSQTLPTPVLQLTFKTYLTSSTAKVYLDSANLYGQRQNCDCAALSTAGPDSVQINFTGCEDSLILAAMNDSLPFYIESIQPNPAQDEIQIRVVAGDPASLLQVQMYDALGREVTTPQPPSSLGGGVGGTVVLDVSGVPSGIYFIRVSAGGYVQSRSVVIQK